MGSLPHFELLVRQEGGLGCDEGRHHRLREGRIAMTNFLRSSGGAANPWGEGATTLEWTLTSPPPFHQFETLPVVD